MKSSSWSVLAALLSIAGVLAPVSSAKEPAAAEVLRRAEELRLVSQDHAVELKLRTYSPSGKSPERIATFSVAARGRAQALFVRHTPKMLQGGAFLIASDGAWNLPPRGVDQAVKPNAGQIVMGEIAAPVLWRLDLADGWSVRDLGLEEFDGTACRKLELTRKTDALYRRVVYWIAKKRSLPKRIEYYGAEPERLLRIARYESFESGPFGLRPVRFISEGGNPWEDVVDVTLSGYRKLELDGLALDADTMRAARDLARLSGPPATAPDFVLEDLLKAIRSQPRPSADSTATPQQ